MINNYFSLVSLLPTFDNIPLIFFCLFIIPPVIGGIFAYRAKKKKVGTFFFTTFLAAILIYILPELTGIVV